jgi:polyhydroxyalkanoate synthesis regulator phasin
MNRAGKEAVMQDAWRAYLQLALGLTEASKKRAQKVAKKLVGTSGVTAGQVQAFVEELASTSAANREALTKLIRFEVDRALGAVGLATAEEVADLTERVRELERELQDARAATAKTTAAAAELLDGVPAAGASGVLAEPRGAAPGGAAGGTVPVEKAVAKRAPAKKAVAKKAVAKKAVAKKTSAGSLAKKTGGGVPGRETPPAPGARP